MSGLDEAHKRLLEAETAVSDVKRWGALIAHLGTADESPEPMSLYVLGGAIEQLGEQIEVAWRQAHKALVEARR